MTIHRTERRGFTAIELLIVVAIVALLAALTAGAVFRTLRSQDAAYAEATITKVASLLDNHWSAVVDAAKREFDGLPTNVKQNLLALADNATASAQTPKPHPRRDDRARLLYVKFRLKQEFPTSFFDAVSPATDFFSNPANPVDFLPSQTYPNLKTAALRTIPFTGKPAYVKFVDEFISSGAGSAAKLPNLAALQTFLSTQPSPGYQSSALLVLSLEQARGGLSPTPLETVVGTNFVVSAGEDLPLKLQGQAVRLPRYLADTWGNPLQFFTFPVGKDPEYANVANQTSPSTADLNVTLTPTPAQPVRELLRVNTVDPQDPEGLLMDPAISGWQAPLPTVPAAPPVAGGALTVPAFARLLHPQVNPGPVVTGQPLTFRRMVPVIASAGPDGDFGGVKNPVSAVVSIDLGAAAANPWMYLPDPLPANAPNANQPNPGSYDNIYSYRLRQSGARGG